MNVDELMAKARDAMTVGRVFGEPIERGGVTVVPVAFVAGGGGGGGGNDPEGGGGSGGGFGLAARPVGAYVIKDGNVSFRPAISGDVVVGAISAIALAIIRSRRKG